MRQFVLTAEHIKLLQASYWDYREDCGFGAAGIDQNRPYGNSSVEIDICEILDISIGDDGFFTPEIENYCQKIHKETAIAIQIILQCKTFEPGNYTLTNNCWRKSNG